MSGVCRPASSGRRRLRVWHRERRTPRSVGTRACGEAWCATVHRPRQERGRGQHGRGSAGAGRRLPAVSLHVSRGVTRPLWRGRGVSPGRGRAHRRHRHELLRGLLVPLAPIVALLHTARHCVTVPPPRARAAGPHRSWYHQQRLRVSVFSLQGGLTYVAYRHTADLDPVPGPAGHARHFWALWYSPECKIIVLSTTYVNRLTFQYPEKRVQRCARLLRSHSTSPM